MSYCGCLSSLKLNVCEINCHVFEMYVAYNMCESTYVYVCVCGICDMLTGLCVCAWYTMKCGVLYMKFSLVGLCM